MGHRRVSAAYGSFRDEMNRLKRLDDLNQERFYPGPGRPGRERLTKSQMHLLTEGILARAFSRYEAFIEQAFLLYCQGKPSKSGRKVRSYLAPRNASHARSLVQSGMTFLEWNSADNVIERSKTYLYPDSPIFTAMTAYRARLSNIRRVRNAIAHCSVEARAHFLKVVRDELGVAPNDGVDQVRLGLLTPDGAPLEIGRKLQLTASVPFHEVGHVVGPSIKLFQTSLRFWGSTPDRFLLVQSHARDSAAWDCAFAQLPDFAAAPRSARQRTAARNPWRS